jgi:hypothetical protein
VRIENEESCQKSQSFDVCFYAAMQELQSDQECMKFKSALGKYYCLVRFPNSKMPENKNLCQGIPGTGKTYYTKQECLSDFAQRYQDSTLCKEIPDADNINKEKCLRLGRIKP